jgi:hypothetical protein
MLRLIFVDPLRVLGVGGFHIGLAGNVKSKRQKAVKMLPEL